jgi:cyclase
MKRSRIIPILLLNQSGLYKTQRFSEPKYIGDPINAIRIFNEKEVDELIFLDISATIEGKEPDLKVLRDIAGECFMPLSFGGGIKSVEMIREILNVGVEKVALNTAAVQRPSLIRESADFFGNSTIVVSIDVKQNLFGKYSVYIYGGREKTNLNPIDWAREAERLGAGEILLNSIDQDGMMKGYDWRLIKSVADAVSIPVVAAGGAGSIYHFVRAINECSVSAVAAGSYFVFQGKHRAVLITYPSRLKMQSALATQLPEPLISQLN